MSLFDRDQRLSIQVNSVTERGWTALGEWVSNLTDEEYTRFIEMISPARTTPAAFVEQATENDIDNVRALARLAVAELLDRHYKNKAEQNEDPS